MFNSVVIEIAGIFTMKKVARFIHTQIKYNIINFLADIWILSRMGRSVCVGKEFIKHFENMPNNNEINNWKPNWAEYLKVA